MISAGRRLAVCAVVQECCPFDLVFFYRQTDDCIYDRSCPTM
jgi:hypothetical protein